MTIQSFVEYQDKASETAIYSSEWMILYPTLGLAGEAGELSNKVKKLLRDANGNVSEQARLDIMGEIGDVLWYVAALCNDLDASMEIIATENINKLQSRKRRGVLRGSGDTR